MRSLLAYSRGTVVEEKVSLRIRADNSGDIYLPVAGYSTDGTQTCEYDWKVSIDGGEETVYSGVGGLTGIRVGYGLNPLSVHTVIIKPNDEEYGWLRAFGYKGTTYGSSLINIISDKSYKGYGVSDVFSGNYFKAYQYYGCNNLINTDEELLPDTLEIIGDYYRYYEYAGCSSLVSNADEKILKTVKSIGDYYRAYQYENCSSINKINMRAINRASVGNNYRYNQYSGIGTDRKPVDIYIEGGIEEGGSWGLVNSNVKGVYVYKDLVSDYQTKLSDITASKIKKNAEWDNNEYEFIEFIGLADSSGNIRVPIGGFSTTMTQDCAYDWMISVDGEEAVEYSGTGDDSYISVGSGLTEGSEHRVVIKPKTIGWGWGRAFGYLSTGAQNYIKELIHDSYKCFAVSRTDTGAHYKHATFTGCTNLINSYEKLPTSVETVGDYYMKECYAGCTGLKTAFWEVMHSGATIGEDYRHHEYTGCTGLEVHQGIAGYTGTTYPTNYKYEYLSGAGDDMVVYITRYEALASGLTNSMGIADNKVSEIYVEEWYNFEYVKSNYWSNITDTKFKAKYYNYVVHQFHNLDEYVLIGSQGLSSPKRDGYYDMGINYGFAIGPGEKAIYTGLHYSTDSYSYPGIMEFKFGTPGDLTTVSTRTNYLTLGSPGYIRGLDKVNGKLYCDYYETGPEKLYEKKGILPGGLLSGISFTSTLLWQRPGNGGTYQGFAISKEELYRYWGYDNPNEGQNYPRYRGDYKLVRFWNSPTYNYINMRFSDDGYTGYLNGKQYSLTIPFNVSTATEVSGITGPSGQYSFTTNGKRLYVLNGGTVSLYEYQE